MPYMKPTKSPRPCLKLGGMSHRSLSEASLENRLGADNLQKKAEDGSTWWEKVSPNLYGRNNIEVLSTVSSELFVDFLLLLSTSQDCPGLGGT